MTIVRQAEPFSIDESKTLRWGSLPHVLFFALALIILATTGLILGISGSFKPEAENVAAAGLPTPLVIHSTQALPTATATPVVTATAEIKLDPSPTVSVKFPTLEPTREVVRAHLSYYWPPFGDMNCFHDCAHVANGDDWQNWVGTGLACPSIYPLGTVFMIMGEEWRCVDRGEAITVNKDGTIWLDLLISRMPYGLAWGAVRSVEIRRKP
jgi:hypothetical protein